MLHYEQIIPECYVDTNLIGTLLDANVNHRLGCTQVAGLMKGRLKEQFAAGIIDYDKLKPAYLSEFSQIANRLLPKQEANEKDICIHLFQHQQCPHFLITIEPAIEKFILRCAKLSNVRLEDYNLPNSFVEFKNVTKRKESNKDPNLRRLFKALLDAQNTDLLAIQRTLNYFVVAQKNVKTGDLIQLFTQ